MDMTTTTSPRLNRFAAECEHCGARLDPGAGHIYKQYPFGPRDPWLARCLDESGCADRQTASRDAALAAFTDRRADEHAGALASYDWAKKNGYTPTDRALAAVRTERARACAVDLPKTVRVPDLNDEGVTTFARRNVKDGVSLRIFWTGPTGERINVDRLHYDTDAEAVAHVIEHVRSNLDFYRGDRETDTYKTVRAMNDAWLVEWVEGMG